MTYDGPGNHAMPGSYLIIIRGSRRSEHLRAHVGESSLDLIALSIYDGMWSPEIGIDREDFANDVRPDNSGEKTD